jgi:uridylate kinase
MNRPAYKRILLKLSGEALAGKAGHGFDLAILAQIADEIKDVHAEGVEIGIVIGAGNIFRGATCENIPRTSGDAIGMLATAINSLMVKEYLTARGIDARVMSALAMPEVAETFVSERARRHLAKKRVVIIAGGTGNPYFTTDTAAALRCLEIGADVLFKATKVDGVYDSDPMKNPNAKKFTSLTHAEALKKNLKIMDATAFSLCADNNVTVVVFKMSDRGNLKKCIEGQPIGTIVRKD